MGSKKDGYQSHCNEFAQLRKKCRSSSFIGTETDRFCRFDNGHCAPAAEAMLEVEGIEANFAAASGIASLYILWSVTAVVLEEMMKRGKTPRLLKSANFPGGVDYNNAEVYPHYKEFGW